MKSIVSILLLVIILFPLKLSAASYRLTGITEKDAAKCLYELNIYIDTEGGSTNAADLIVKYSPNEVTIIDSDKITAGTQIIPGNAYESYVYNKVDDSIGEIKLTAIRFDKLVGKSLFATIPFIARVQNPSFKIQFDGIGNTYDSNIAEYNTSDDILSNVAEEPLTVNNYNCSLTEDDLQNIPVTQNETIMQGIGLNPSDVVLIAMGSSVLTIGIGLLIILLFVRVLRRKIMIVDSNDHPIKGALINIYDDSVLVNSYITNKKGFIYIKNSNLHKTTEVTAKNYTIETFKLGLQKVSKVILKKD